jgi:glycogen debranching enzyme
VKRISYLIPDGRPLTEEEQQAWKQLASLRGYKATQASYAQASAEHAAVRTSDIIWWHCDGAYPTNPELHSLLPSLRRHAEKGGGILLSLLAAQAAFDLGLEDVRPNVIAQGEWSELSWARDYPDIRGFAGFGNHPVFEGCPGGMYTWAPELGTAHSGCYYDGVLPRSGKIVGLEKLYIKINDQRRILMEYNPRKARILSVGLHFYFANASQRFRPHLEKLLSNALQYLSRTGTAGPFKHSYWDFEPRRITSTIHTSKAFRKSIPHLPNISSGLEIHRVIGAHDQFFDLSGRRIVMMGHERGGISEIWSHPTRLFQNIRLGFKVGDAPWQWSDQLDPTITVKPESLTRRYEYAGAQIRETLFASLRSPAGVLHYEVTSTQPVKILATARTDFRIMWPLSEHATGSLEYSWDSGLHAHLIRDTRGKNAALFGSSSQPSQHLSGQFSQIILENDSLVGISTADSTITSGITLALEPGNRKCCFVFAGSGVNHEEAFRSYRNAAANAARLLNEQVRRFKQLHSQRLQIITPDGELNQSFRWSIVSTEKLYAQTPGLGASFLAGFGLSSSGWDGGQKISGRPGYAWYFGRDSVWTSLGVLGYGDFGKVRTVLEFLGQHQDPDGKILHEFTTSGYAHYDAADSTPLYLILFGRYLRASGDLAFARREFDTIKKAVAYCLSTDSDHDHLIENTNVGHGWIEGGSLFPSHSEHYLASCWAQALRETAFVATALGDNTLSTSCQKIDQRVRTIVRKSFLNRETGFYNFARNQDGTYRTEKTVLPTVGMYFDCAEERFAEQSLVEYASDNFSADWGVRIVGKNDPLYEPTGYHYGSVWPLFTGWTSLAEFRLHRPVQGFNHLMSNALLFNQFAAGSFEEVLHGQRFEPAGVCSHQAWSASMVIQPVIEGLLGIKVDARAASLEIRPFLPPQWNTCEVKNIRIGDRRLRMTIERTKEETVFVFVTHAQAKKKSQRPVRLTLQPVFPLGTIVRGLTINGKQKPLRIDIQRYDSSPEIQQSFNSRLEVSFKHELGVSVVPQKPHFVKGEESRGLRIIQEQWNHGTYTVTAEGRAGQEYLVDVIDAAQRVTSIDGAVPVVREKNVLTISVVFPDHGGAAYNRKQFQLSL